MSRDDGFAVADVSTDLLDDPKVKALWRELADQGRMGHALSLFTATVLASWRQGFRVTVADSAPVWLTLDDELVAALVKVRLLDRTGRLPLRSWKGWFSPAWDRRETRRRSGALGGLRQHGKRSTSDATAELQRRYDDAHSDGTPDRPSVRPSGRTVRTVRQDRPSRDDAPSNGANGKTTTARGTGFESVRVTAAALGIVK